MINKNNLNITVLIWVDKILDIQQLSMTSVITSIYDGKMYELLE